MSYLRVFLIFLPDLITLMTRHVMRAAVSTQTKMTMFFRVGRCVMMDEIRDPTAASVTFLVSSSSLMIGEDGDVEFNCVAGEERVCGTPLTRQRAAMTKVKTRLNATMVMKSENTRRMFFFPTRLEEMRQQLSHYKGSIYPS